MKNLTTEQFIEIMEGDLCNHGYCYVTEEYFLSFAYEGLDWPIRCYISKKVWNLFNDKETAQIAIDKALIDNRNKIAKFLF
jgi:hypothetical protein